MDLRNCDNIELMKQFEDKHFDLAIVDPPYGIGAGKRQGTTYTKGKGGKGFYSNKIYIPKDWDNATPTPEYWKELFRVSKNQIVWGGNYFADQLPISRGWIFWDKKIANSTTGNFSDGELAWTSFDRVLKKITYDWIGFGYLNNSRGQKRIHPTEKPIDLYRKVLKEFATKGDKILDTHLGSGSIAVACHEEGFDLTACEIDVDYFNDAMERIKNDTAQTSLFLNEKI